MNVQVITRDGEPEYAVLPWDEYQALLKAAGRDVQVAVADQPARDSHPLQQLRSLREAQGRTAEDLARSVGISPAYLALIEAGERDPDAAIRRSLAHALGIARWEDDA
ncbi:transcriptional regulator [Stutzerimonas nosocomialis]|uniref:Transcriptional regulator n=1 Tax=Stutzerimonas nosocomialis TaxID=1056496 RepID=A0A5R9QD55_9GAMM|nr:helix-turn-helix transcriptional regulator [Stutzerimonas nosocomialis]TLX59530.1 transcriptional regulator [Stutzerimonas nosocomialis]TLX63021.1 transcriptional regulator [Stutzerimonas nosocomialis]